MFCHAKQADFGSQVGGTGSCIIAFHKSTFSKYEVQYKGGMFFGWGTHL